MIILYWFICVDLYDFNYLIFIYMYIYVYNLVYIFIWYMLYCLYKGVLVYKEEVLVYDDEWYKYNLYEGILCVLYKIISMILE